MSNRDEDGPGFKDLAKAIKALAQLIAILVMVVWWFVEFKINPHQNIDFHMFPGQTYEIEGINCHGDDQNWKIRIDSIEKSGKHHIAKATRWVEMQEGGRLREEEIEISQKTELKFPQCGDEEVDVSLVWSIDPEDGIHLRIHPPFRIPQ